MKNKTPFPMTPFDMLVIPENLHIMKLLLPYLPPGIQKIMAIWIKLTELQNTMAFFQSTSRFDERIHSAVEQTSAAELFEELRPYMKEEEAEQIDMVLSAMSMMEMMQDSESGNTSSTSADILRSMMPAGSEEMFDLYSQMFEKGGDDRHESEGQSMGGMDEESDNSKSGSAETGTDEDSL